MNQRRKHRKKKSPTGLLVVILVLATVIPMIFLFLKNSDESSLPAAEILSDNEHRELFDENAEDFKKHFWEKDEKNKEGDFSFEMKDTVSLGKEEQKGRINLVNPHCNNYFMFLELSLNEDETVFFRSGLLKPGQKLKEITIDEPLEEGVHEAKACIGAVSPENYELLGYLSRDITVKVKN